MLFRSRFGIPAKRYGLFASIRGDASDGLPGVKGIGEKGAAALAQEFENLDQILESAKKDERIPAKLRTKILDNVEYVKIAEELTTCRQDLDLPKTKGVIPKKILDEIKLNSLKSEYSLTTSVERLISVAGIN